MSKLKYAEFYDLYVEGRLEPELRKKIDVYLALDPRAARVVDDLRRMKSDLSSVGSVGVPDDFLGAVREKIRLQERQIAQGKRRSDGALPREALDSFLSGLFSGSRGLLAGACALALVAGGFVLFSGYGTSVPRLSQVAMFREASADSKAASMKTVASATPSAPVPAPARETDQNRSEPTVRTPAPPSAEALGPAVEGFTDGGSVAETKPDTQILDKAVQFEVRHDVSKMVLNSTKPDETRKAVESMVGRFQGRILSGEKRKTLASTSKSGQQNHLIIAQVRSDRVDRFMKDLNHELASAHLVAAVRDQAPASARSPSANGAITVDSHDEEMTRLLQMAALSATNSAVTNDGTTGSVAQPGAEFRTIIIEIAAAPQG